MSLLLLQHTQALTVFILFFGGILLCGNGLNSQYHRKDHNDTPTDVLLLAGSLLLSQAMGVLVLFLQAFSKTCHCPSDCPSGTSQTTTIACCRAASISTTLTGLSLTMCSTYCHPNMFVLVLLVTIGMTLFISSSATLMILFWPYSTVVEDQTTTTTTTLVSALRNEERMTHDQPQHLLSNAWIVDEERAESVEGHCNYQLLVDQEESIQESTNQTHVGDEISREDVTALGNPTNNLLQSTDDLEDIDGTGRIRGTRRLLQLVAPEVTYLYAGCFVLLCRLPFSLAMPHFVSTTLAALGTGNFSVARHEILLLFLAGTIDAVLDFWGFFLFGYANQRIVKGLRVDLFRRLLSQEVAFFDQCSSGELASRLNSDCSEMAGDLTWFFRFSIESIVRITGITCYMLLRSPRLGLCALSIVPSVAIVNKLYGDWLRRNAIQVQDALAEANSVAQEALANVRTVLAFAAERRECKRYDSKIERQFLLNVKQLYMTAAYYMFVNTFLINTIVQGMLLWIGMNLIQHNKLTPAILLAFMLYQSQLQNETMNLMNSYTSLIKSSGAGDKVFSLLDRSPPPPSTGFADNCMTEDRPEEREEVVNGSHDDTTTISEQLTMGSTKQKQFEIVMEKVCFRYPSRADHLVLNELDLKITKGTTVALVGKSGSGKSTIVSLLQRFYDPTSGQILINGVDLRALDLSQYRRQIGVVAQEPALFRGTLWDNIAYGCEDNICDIDIHRAARLAHADTFIQSFPDGYQTSIGERGVQLSGGQKQRVGIARAVALQHGQPSLLILDEATSMLDYASETAVQEALDQLLLENEDMTTVIVAHRLRTVRKADCIFVIQEGRVVEQGSHEELIELCGVYREMVDRAGSTGVLPEH